MATISPLPNFNLKSAQIIANNTANTWQQDRSQDWKNKDTNLGKIAEEVFEIYIKNNKPWTKYLSYDSFRTNNFKKVPPLTE